MKKGKILVLIIIITACSLSLVAAKTAVHTPKDAIESTVEAVLDLLRDKDLAAPERKEERRDKINLFIRGRFDFKEMSRRTLAKHWKKRTPEETEEFVNIFSDLLVASYIGKVEAYTDETVTYDKEVIKGKGKYGVVSTTIVTKDVDIPLDYKLILKKDKWWVYDVVVEGVSFISTYRSQYNKIITRESYAKLIEKMKKKLDKVNAL
jgi:phospholipid transport system substrate-binding protein